MFPNCLAIFSLSASSLKQIIVLLNFSLPIVSFRIWVQGKTIGSAREIKGSYYFDDGAIREEQVQVAKKVPSVSDEIRLWHWHLERPNFPYLKRLFPWLFKNINMSQFNCEV